MILENRIIAVQPLGDVSPGILKAVASDLQATYRIEAALFPAQALPDKAFDPQRRQHNCYPILQYLNQLRPDHAVKIVGVTEVDLFIPILTYVFGEAELGGHATVISTCRLMSRTNPEQLAAKKLFERAGKIAVHEVAHTFRLPHCREDGCIMGSLPARKNIDEMHIRFCRHCSTYLRDEYERLGLF